MAASSPPCILVTRPRHQAASLCQSLRARGMRPVEFPLLRIEASLSPRDAGCALDAMEQACAVVFVSANAVSEALRLRPQLLSRLARVSILAPGGGTAGALERAGRSDVQIPVGSTSESLLQLPVLQPARIQGRSVGLVKGEGGRDLLARALAERGARVLEAVVYRRLGPGAGFRSLLQAHDGSLAAAIVTSAEALGHLARLARGPSCQQALGWPLVLPSERVARRARELGFVACTVVSPVMSDDALADAAWKLVSRRAASPP